MRYDAIIKNYVREGNVIWGYIYGDSKGRFVDDTFIHTSRIVNIKDDILETRNSVYKLEEPYVKPKTASMTLDSTGPHW